MKWLRIFAKANPDDWDGNWDIIIDVVVDDAGLVCPKICFFGVCGGFESSNAMPFLLRPDGSIEFGCLVGPEEIQLSKTNLHQRSVKLDEYFTHFHDDDEVVMQIVKITDLLEN